MIATQKKVVVVEQGYGSLAPAVEVGFQAVGFDLDQAKVTRSRLRTPSAESF